VQRGRPGQFVVLAAWKDKVAWDAHVATPAAKAFREKLASLRNASAADRFHNAFSVGPMEDPSGAVYGVTHVDVIPPQKDNAIVALKVLGEANRLASGNVRFEVVQQTNRPTTSRCSRSGARTRLSTRTACRRTSASSATSSREWPVRCTTNAFTKSSTSVMFRM
jgi:quinol monooxygenase YgiN